MGLTQYPYRNTKDPEARLDYGFDWTDWLEDDDTISEAEWDVPTGLTEVSSNIEDDVKAVVWLSGGTDGETYMCICHIVTSPGGREDERTLVIQCVQR